MNAWIGKGLLVVELILLLALILFAIFVYRSNRSAPFLLLMLAVICHFHSALPCPVCWILGNRPWLTGKLASLAADVVGDWYHERPRSVISRVLYRFFGRVLPISKKS